MGLSKLLRSAPAHPTWLGCQSAWLHFRSVLTAKDLKFRFHTSALPWLPKTWCSAFTFPLCLDWQRSEVPRPPFRSALTAKNVKFRVHIRTSALPLLPNMWSSAPALPLCLYWQRSEVPLSALVLPGLPKMWSSASAFHLCLDFQRFAVSLLHFRSVLPAKDLKIGFSTKHVPIALDHFHVLKLQNLAVSRRKMDLRATKTYIHYEVFLFSKCIIYITCTCINNFRDKYLSKETYLQTFNVNKYVLNQYMD